jgi:hypothetical protein
LPEVILPDIVVACVDLVIAVPVGSEAGAGCSERRVVGSGSTADPDVEYFSSSWDQTFGITSSTPKKIDIADRTLCDVLGIGNANAT